MGVHKDEAEQQIPAQDQPRSTCPWCRGEKELTGRRVGIAGQVATILCPKCKGEGTVPAGSLAQWRDKARRITLGIASCIASPPSALPHLQRLQAHLAAMPQPEPNAGLLGALKIWRNAVYACEAKTCKQEGRWHITEINAAMVKQTCAAIDQAEKGAAG